MTAIDLRKYGMPLVQAARAMGLTVPDEVEPQDKSVTANGLRFHYLDWGTAGKPVMLLLHGAYQTAHAWDFFSLAMREHYWIYSLDQRGHGDSDWAPDGDYSSGACLRDLEGFFQAVGLAHVRLLMGNALGGINALVFAAHHPDMVQSLAIVDATSEAMAQGVASIRRFITGPDELDSIEDFVERAHRFNQQRSKEQLRGSLKHNLRQLPNGKWTWKYDKLFREPNPSRPRAPTFDLWDLMGRAQCPTLVVRGAQSSVFTEETAIKMRNALARGHLATIERAGHMAMGDNPKDFESAVRVFLKDIR